MLEDKISRLESENKMLRMQNAGEQKQRVMGNSNTTSQRQSQTALRQSSQKQITPVPAKRKSGYFLIGQPIGPTMQRVLTLKQLKDVIADIYSQKIKFDKKCEALKQPRETMEQYMYTYLNQKYGLKNLIIEWAAAIINGIKTYLREDHDVTLFGKILKNECDEEFRFIQAHVKDTLSALLRVLLKERHSYKNENDITKLHDSVIQGNIEEWMWRKIIEKMYDPRDFEILEHRFSSLLEEKRLSKLPSSALAASGPSEKVAQKKLSREEMMARFTMSQQQPEKLSYSEFQKTILDFQLSEHEKFLHDFTELFKQVDRDRNGLIDEMEFRDLLIQMRVLPEGDEDQELIILLQVIDPYNNQKLTYSEIVHLLSSHMLPISEENSNTTSILEKFVNIRTGGAYLTSERHHPSQKKSGLHSTGNSGVMREGQEDIRQMIMSMRNLQEHDGQQVQQQEEFDEGMQQDQDY